MAKTDRSEPAVPAGVPIRTTVEDAVAVCSYLLRKPTGATLAEMRAVVNAKHLDSRKIAAMKRWNLLEDTGGRYRLLDRGRRFAKDSGAHKAAALLEVVREIEPYGATVERAAHSGELTVSATETAAHWHENFRGQVSANNAILNEQVICFFQIAEGSDLGSVVVGRRGQPTRFEFDKAAVEQFLEGAVGSGEGTAIDAPSPGAVDADTMARVIMRPPGARAAPGELPAVSRVFVTHGKNIKVLDQVKRLLKVAKFEAVVAQEREAAAKPVPEKVMEDMRSCQAAVIHVGSEGSWVDADGKQQPHINGNVLIEVGAAMALYSKRFILLVEEGVKLPSNLQGLYECRYSGDELSLDGAMKLVEALNTLR